MWSEKHNERISSYTSVSELLKKKQIEEKNILQKYQHVKQQLKELQDEIPKIIQLRNSRLECIGSFIDLNENLFVGTPLLDDWQKYKKVNNINTVKRYQEYLKGKIDEADTIGDLKPLTKRLKTLEEFLNCSE